MRQTDYAKWMTPRVPGLPWTAPAYDHLSVKANPRVFCIAVEDGSTHCVTEQGTDIDVPAAVARQIAAHGVYDPFLDSREQASRSMPDQMPQRREGAMQPAGPPQAAQAASLTAGAASGEGASALVAGGGIHAVYAPPTTGPWNPNG